MLVEIINKLLDFLRNENPNIRVLFVNSIKGTTDVLVDYDTHSIQTEFFSTNELEFLNS